jgi:hypothetical protein
MIDVMNDEQTPAPVQQWLSSLTERLMDSDTPDERFVKGTPIPPGLGAQADEYAAVREERLRIEKEAKAVKEREMEIYNCIMSTLDESTDTGASGKFYRVQRVEKEQNQVKDWQEVHNWILKNQNFEILGRSINQKAVREYFEGGEAIPGIEVVEVPTLSFKKVD